MGTDQPDASKRGPPPPLQGPLHPRAARTHRRPQYRGLREPWSSARTRADR